MNEKKINFNLYAIVAFSLALLVPLPGRFAYGIIFFIAVNFFMFAGTLFKKLISELDMDEMQPLALALILIACAVFVKLLLMIYSPVIALTLGFSLYMCALSAFMLGSLYDKNKKPLSEELKLNMKRSGLYSLLALVFFFVRDFLGYGTITLPVRNGFYYIKIFPETSKYFSVSSFFASLPGAILLTVLTITLFTFIDKKISIKKVKREENNTAVKNENLEAKEKNIDSSVNTGENLLVNESPENSADKIENKVEEVLETTVQENSAIENNNVTDIENKDSEESILDIQQSQNTQSLSEDNVASTFAEENKNLNGETENA